MHLPVGFLPSTITDMNDEKLNIKTDFPAKNTVRLTASSTEEAHRVGRYLESGFDDVRIVAPARKVYIGCVTSEQVWEYMKGYQAWLEAEANKAQRMISVQMRFDYYPDDHDEDTPQPQTVSEACEMAVDDIAIMGAHSFEFTAVPEWQLAVERFTKNADHAKTKADFDEVYRLFPDSPSVELLKQILTEFGLLN